MCHLCYNQPAGLRCSELWEFSLRSPSENRNPRAALFLRSSFLSTQTPTWVRHTRGKYTVVIAPNQMQIFSLEGSSVRVSWESLQRTHSSHPTLTNLGRSATRISVLFAAAAQQQKEQGEEEMALKAFANAPAPRATSELFFLLFTLIMPQHQCSFPVQLRSYLLIFKSPLG